MRPIPSALIIGVVCGLWACRGEVEPHDHGEEHPAGHDHHEEGHGHGDEVVVGITAWSDRFELFAEHPAAVVGEPLSFLAHLTDLQGFTALEQGTVSIEFTGPADLRGEATSPLRPGIYVVTMTPTKAGTYRGRLRVRGSVESTIEALSLTVFATDEEAAHSAGDDDDSGVIEFLKEQQWGVPFGTAFAAEGTIIGSIEVAGRVDTPPNGSAEVGAAVSGRVVAPAGGLPRPWTEVRKGQVLGALMPTPSSPEAAARASLVVAEAQARANAASMALTRAERLIGDEAISQRELEEARREAQVAKASVAAAQQAAALYAGASSASGRGTWKLVAPISGRLASVEVRPGAMVSPADVLFRIVDTRELWISAKVPEQDAVGLRTDRAASYRIAGSDVWHTIDVGGEGAHGLVIAVGRTVHPVSRTVELIYALRDAPEGLRVGGLVTVHVPVGDDFSGIVIPRSALVDQDGRSVVYVQVDGEHFAERAVRVGARAGDRVGIERGLRAGERIVVEGAHLVRLADRAKGGGAHGHIH